MKSITKNINTSIDGYRIYIPNDIWKQIWTMVNWCEYEIGALMSCSLDKKAKMFRIDKLYIPSQEVTGATVSMDDGESPDALVSTDELGIQSLIDGNQLNGWVHSHVYMDTGFSCTDDENIQKWLDFGYEWYISVCVNKNRDINGRIDIQTGGDIPIRLETKLEVIVEESIDNEIIKLLETKGMVRVKKITYNSNKRTNSYKICPQKKYHDVKFDDIVETIEFKREELEAIGINTTRMNSVQVDELYDISFIEDFDDDETVYYAYEGYEQHV